VTEGPAFRLGLELVDWLSAEQRVDAARHAEEQGFDDLFMAEIGDPDVFVIGGLVLEKTSSIRFGTCIVQIGPRSVPMIAASAATLANLFPGRFALGVGISSQAIVEGWHGVPWTNPLVRAEESVMLLKSLLSGDRADHRGREVRSKGFRLSQTPDVRPPVQLAALNQSMLRLAARSADGVWLNYVPRHRVEAVVSIIREEAHAHDVPQPEILLSLACQVTDDPNVARAQLREVLMFYVASPAYRRAWTWHGFPREMAAAQLALDSRDKEALKATITNELIDSLSLIGSPSDIRGQLDQYRQAGITTLSIGPVDERSLRFVLEDLVHRESTQ
jgi:probable F420-dependent oxidoreductase